MTEERRKLLHPTSLILCEVYNTLVQKGEVFFLLQDEQIEKLDTIVKTVNSNFFNIVRFPTPELQAAAYFYFIIKDHPLTDGNKRLAVLWLETFCNATNLKISLPKGLTLDVLAVMVEKTKNIDNDTLFGSIEKILFKTTLPSFKIMK